MNVRAFAVGLALGFGWSAGAWAGLVPGPVFKAGLFVVAVIPYVRSGRQMDQSELLPVR